MCYSLLLVTFKNDKTKQTAECATEVEERSKIKEFCDKEQVSKVAVFRCHRHEVRREVWDSVPYSPPVPDPPRQPTERERLIASLPPEERNGPTY